MKPLISILRPKQWIKNGFIFLPLIFGQKLFVYPENLNAILAFVLFSCAASASYVLNDIYDAVWDRQHPVKRLRPIAAGIISSSHAWFLVMLLVSFSLFFAFKLSSAFGYVLTAYVIFNYFYSRFLKEEVIIDVFCLGLFFLLRIIAGNVSTHVEWSYWMSVMVVLLALFLGFNKRRQELNHYGSKAGSHRKVLEKYDAYFIDQMISIVTSSIVVVYMLYTVDARTVRLFGNIHLIYSIPFVYYGIFRYHWLIHKLNSDGDPTSVLLSDRKMQINILLWILVCISVIYFHL